MSSNKRHAYTAKPYREKPPRVAIQHLEREGGPACNMLRGFQAPLALTSVEGDVTCQRCRVRMRAMTHDDKCKGIDE